MRTHTQQRHHDARPRARRLPVARPKRPLLPSQAALDTGYRHIDTAAAYGNEREVGEGIRRSGLDRGDVFIETKVWVSDYGYDETLHAWEKATGKLGVDHARPAHPAPAGARPVREDDRRLQGARDPPRRRPGPFDRRQQLHAPPPRSTARRDRRRACGEPGRASPLLHASPRCGPPTPRTESSPRPGRRSAASPSTPAGARTGRA